MDYKAIQEANREADQTRRIEALENAVEFLLGSHPAFKSCGPDAMVLQDRIVDLKGDLGEQP